MKKTQLSATAFCSSLCSVALTSCLGDDEEDEENCYDELQRLSQIANEKAQALSTNMTTANCNAFKEAALKFYNKAKECGDRDMISAAEQSIAITESMNCNDL